MNSKLQSKGYTAADPVVPVVGVYWVAVKGEAMSVMPPNAGNGSCIARVEDDVCEAYDARGGGYNDVYAVWQPKDCSTKNWARWCKKWSARTGGAK